MKRKKERKRIYCQHLSVFILFLAMCWKVNLFASEFQPVMILTPGLTTPPGRKPTKSE